MMQIYDTPVVNNSNTTITTTNGDTLWVVVKRPIIESPCMHDNQLPGTIMGVVCNCPKCEVTCY